MPKRAKRFSENILLHTCQNDHIHDFKLIRPKQTIQTNRTRAILQTGRAQIHRLTRPLRRGKGEPFLVLRTLPIEIR